jgi:hypothetical protein
MNKRLPQLLLGGMLLFVSAAKAQMPHDAIYMPKNTVCIAASYTNSSWSEYWENTLLRENLNMGTHTTQSFMPMIAAGISDKLNVIVGLPYIQTKTSAGNLMGQKGIQDLSAFLKYKMVDKKGLNLNAVLGFSAPMSNYVPDFLPMSIGLKAKSATARLIANYHHKSGIYLQGHGSYIYRGTMKIDKDAYQADYKIYNSNIVAIPNATDLRGAIGFLKKAIQVEAFYEKFGCINGDNIRRNDMPFPTNNMQVTSLGGYLKFQPKNIGFNARFAQTLTGLNVGKTMTYSVGLLYQLSTKKKEITNK